MDWSNPETYDLIAVNDVGQFVNQDVEHWVTLHHAYMPGWMTFRKGHARNRPKTHSHMLPHKVKSPGQNGVDWWWTVVFGGGTSGLFATSAHFFDPPWYRSPGVEDRQQEIVWTQSRDTHLHGKVRSMSGRTAGWLGPPDEEWWHGE
jgi:hypothetical protein